MIHTLLFVIKIIILIALAFLVTTYSGTVTIDWDTYKVETSTTTLIIMVALIIWVVYFLSNLYWRIRRFPLSFARLFRIRTLDNIEYCMRMALESCKSGSNKHLKSDLDRLSKIVADPVLRDYFKAKVEKLNNSPQAVKTFQELSATKSGKFMGNCELAQIAIQEKDYSKALFHTELAHSVHKKSPWVLKTLLKLYLKEGNFSHANTILLTVDKEDALSSDTINSIKAGIYYKQAQNERDIKTQTSLLEKALNHNPLHLPSVLNLAKILVQSHKFRNLQKIIEDVWIENPHADLIQYYLASTNDNLEKAKLMDRLTTFNPDHPITLETAAEVYLQAKLWGKARDTLKKIPNTKLTVNTCRIWASLEASEYDDVKKAQSWYLRMETAFPPPQWKCTKCHHIFVKPEPLCKNCLSLDSIHWQ